jgi:hypothetical protein
MQPFVHTSRKPVMTLAQKENVKKENFISKNMGRNNLPKIQLRGSSNLGPGDTSGRSISIFEKRGDKTLPSQPSFADLDPDNINVKHLQKDYIENARMVNPDKDHL